MNRIGGRAGASGIAAVTAMSVMLMVSIKRERYKRLVRCRHGLPRATPAARAGGRELRSRPRMEGGRQPFDDRLRSVPVPTKTPIMEPYRRHVLVCVGGFCSPDRRGHALYARLAMLLQREGLLFGPMRVKRS